MLGFGRKKFHLAVPFEGRVVPVDEVPDPVFAQRMLGDGFAVVPPEGAGVVDVCAPVAGTLVKVFSTLHAFALKSDEGVEVLVHIGLETVELKGEGFEALAATGDRVEAGQPVIRVDVAAVRAGGRDPITPVVLTRKGQVTDLSVKAGDARAAAAVAVGKLA